MQEKIPQIEVSVKYKNPVKKSELFTIKSSYDLFELFKLLFDEGTINWTEESILLCLNRANKVLGFYKISAGGVTGTILDTKVIFTIALKTAGTVNIVIAHNHPSGNLQPSQADIDVTKKIKGVAQLLDMKLIDHLIITDESYYSFSDNGIL